MILVARLFALRPHCGNQLRLFKLDTGCGFLVTQGMNYRHACRQSDGIQRTAKRGLELFDLIGAEILTTRVGILVALLSAQSV